MLCYKDKTWCPEKYSNGCRYAHQCHRVMDELDKTNTKISGLPVSYFNSVPNCYENGTTYTLECKAYMLGASQYDNWDKADLGCHCSICRTFFMEGWRRKKTFESVIDEMRNALLV